MKKITTGILCLFFTAQAFCFEQVSTTRLLSSFLENDSQLQELSIEVQKQEIELKQNKVDAGINLSLSTGNIVIKNVENDSDGSSGIKVTANPEVSLSLPSVNGLSVNASTDLTINGASENCAENSSLSVGAQIIGTTGKSSKITLQKAERKLEEAKRKLQKRAWSAEKEFYNQLKNLLNATYNIVQKENDLYDDKISFQEIEAQGYSKNSSTYRLAQMKVVSDQHEIECAKRELLHNYVVFYMDCGYEVEFDVNQDFMELVPSDIPLQTALDITDFSKEEFEKIENARWTYEINSLERANKSFFTLSADGGYTFNNSQTNSDSIDGGLSAKIGGVNVSGKVSVPLSGQTNPVYTFCASVNPNVFKTSDFTTQTELLTEKEELLDIQSAQKEYETTVVEQVQTLQNLEWEIKTNDENFQMYKGLEAELSDWYKKGIVTESEYLSAKTKMQLYGVKKIINQIDLIIYNDGVNELFVNGAKK